jgi:AcrR family transcriptional regulator
LSRTAQTEPVRLKMADLERATGVGRSTIHHYMNLGILQRPERRGPKLHFFGKQHLDRLTEIQKLKARDWPLARIRDYLDQRAPAPPAAGPAEEGTDETRRRIVAHATRWFAERGYDRVLLDELARAIGIGKATIYKHFPSKQALLVECVEQVRLSLFPRETRSDLEIEIPLAQRGYARSYAVLQNFETYRALTGLLSSLAHGPDRLLATKARAEFHAMITNAEPYLRELMQLGLAREMDSELLAYMLWGALMGAGERMSLDDKYDVTRVVQEYLGFIRSGMGAGGPRR